VGTQEASDSGDKYAALVFGQPVRDQFRIVGELRVCYPTGRFVRRVASFNSHDRCTKPTLTDESFQQSMHRDPLASPVPVSRCLYIYITDSKKHAAYQDQHHPTHHPPSPTQPVDEVKWQPDQSDLRPRLRPLPYPLKPEGTSTGPSIINKTGQSRSGQGVNSNLVQTRRRRKKKKKKKKKMMMMMKRADQAGQPVVSHSDIKSDSNGWRNPPSPPCSLLVCGMGVD